MVVDDTLYDKAIETIRSKSLGKPRQHLHEITINFHPDRYTADGTPLLVSVAHDRRIRSQFETGTSNGGLTAFFGGDRWKWEQRVFSGTYDTCDPCQRPKYGALNYKNHITGASPRFGSAYFRLKQHVLKRATFCYPDSFFEPENFATYEYVESLIELANSDVRDELNSYVECQVHGELSLVEDVEAIVLDPVYKDTEIEDQARQLPLKLQWHPGYELDIGVMEHNAGYRGQEYVDLAKEIAIHNHINPRILGMAVNESGYEEQDIKKIWHYLAKFGCKSERT